MKWKIIGVAACVALAVVLAVDLLYLHFSSNSALRSLNSASVITQVKQLNELVTVRYSLQRVVGLTEPRGAFGEESILLMVQGQAEAGVDLATMKPGDITFSGKRAVTIRLPRAKLFNTYIDEKQTKVWDRHITWWTPWIPYDPDLEHRARLSAIDDLQSAALGMGILKQAQKNAENAVCDFLKALKIDVEFEAS
ncbi:MAG TPA: DUF4230 domain-containing protein [Bryobacteraceae bacterium]|nr:DUF4230 domain-containing protein [Bryobacteraceae bacterium]